MAFRFNKDLALFDRVSIKVIPGLDENMANLLRLFKEQQVIEIPVEDGPPIHIIELGRDRFIEIFLALESHERIKIILHGQLRFTKSGQVADKKMCLNAVKQLAE